MSELLTLERMKAELRIPANLSNQDSLIRGQITSALSHVERETGWVMRSQSLSAYSMQGWNPVDTQEAILFKVPWRGFRVSELADLAYWSEMVTTSPAPPPDQSIDPGIIDADRIQAGETWFTLPAPTGGWPVEALQNGASADVTIEPDHREEALVAAAVTLVRLHFDGQMQITDNAAYKSLLMPYRPVAG